MVTEKEPNVFIIILCCNSSRWLKPCLESAYRTEYSHFEVVLVDNASTDGSVEEAEALYPNLTVLKNEINLGWCEANNCGIRYALDHGADYIYLSNADVRFFQKDWLSALLKAASEHPEYYVLGPLQYDYLNPNAYNEWTNYILWNGNRDVHHMWSRKLQSETELVLDLDDPANDNILDVAFVQGATMLVSAEAFRVLGMFDGLYHIFFDELDFCRRNLRVGNKVGLVPASGVQHFGSGDCSSNHKRQRKRNYYFSRNKYLYILSDYNTPASIKVELFCKWLFNDMKQSVRKHSDVSDPLQLLHIISDVVCHIPRCRTKLYSEKRLENAIIIGRIRALKTPEKIRNYFGNVMINAEPEADAGQIQATGLWTRYATIRFEKGKYN